MIAQHVIKQGHPAFLPEMEEAAVDALRNDTCLRGENVHKFEEEFARFAGTTHAMTTNSGTDALIFIMKALESKGKRIVTSPFSFIASGNAILLSDGSPVFGDISETEYCIDPLEAEKQLQRGAKALLPVHIFGQPVDFDSFQ